VNYPKWVVVEMQRYQVSFSYIGARFSGLAVQRGHEEIPTVQGALEVPPPLATTTTINPGEGIESGCLNADRGTLLHRY